MTAEMASKRRSWVVATRWWIWMHTGGEPCSHSGAVLPDCEPSLMPCKQQRPACKHPGRWVLVGRREHD